RASIGGPYVDRRRKEFAKDVEKHPEWSQQRVAAMLLAAGAKYPATRKAEFLRSITPEHMKSFVGDLEIVSADFLIRYTNVHVSGETDTALLWRVEAKWHSADTRYEEECL